MLTLYIIGGIVAYLGAGGLVSGYIIGGKDEPEKDKYTGELFFHLFLWPITVAFIPAQFLFNQSFQLAINQKEGKRKKLAVEEKKRIEIETAEKEVEALLDDEEELEVITKQR